MICWSKRSCNTKRHGGRLWREVLLLGLIVVVVVVVPTAKKGVVVLVPTAGGGGAGKDFSHEVPNNG